MMERDTVTLRDAVNRLVDVLDCTRAQATRIIIAARREGYPVTHYPGPRR